MSNTEKSILTEDDKRRLIAVLSGLDDIEDAITIVKEKFSEKEGNVNATQKRDFGFRPASR